MSFLLIITLCNTLSNGQDQCDNYQIDGGQDHRLSREQCTSQLRIETMPFYMQQIWMLNSFADAQCVPDDASIEVVE